jgi:hypothetical protein
MLALLPEASSRRNEINFEAWPPALLPEDSSRRNEINFEAWPVT